MRSFFTIVSREWRAYFLSPLGYVILASFLFMNGLIFAAIVTFLTRHQTLNVTVLDQLRTRVPLPQIQNCTGETSRAHEALQHLILILKAAEAKTALINGFKTLDTLLNSSESLLVEPMLERLTRLLTPERPDVAAFIDRLRTETKTARFDATFEELRSSGASLGELQAIALGLSGATKKPKNKTEALKSIRGQHDAYVRAKRGIDAMGGRSAA